MFAVALACAGGLAATPCELRAARPDWGAYAVCPVGVNPDSADELYSINHYCEYQEKGREKFTWFFHSRTDQGMQGNAWSHDVTGDGVPEIVLVACVRESVWVYIINSLSGERRKSLVTAGLPRSNSVHAFGIDVVAFADLNSDGADDVVLGLSSGYEWRSCPRGVHAIDGRTGEVLWRFGMGPNPEGLVIGDCDQDGSPEIFVSTRSPRNGCEENGTSDANYYVICLDCRGRVRWLNELRQGAGGTVTLAQSLVDCSGRAALVARELCSYEGANPDALVVLDAATGAELHREAAEGPEREVFVGDLDADGSSEIITSEAGVVKIRDLALKVRAKRSLESDEATILLCDHLLGRRTMAVSYTHLTLPTN